MPTPTEHSIEQLEAWHLVFDREFESSGDCERARMSADSVVPYEAHLLASQFPRPRMEEIR